MALHLKVLSFTLDQKLTYNTHIQNISLQAHTPLQKIKALTATRCGKQKEHSWLPIRQSGDRLWSMPPPYCRLLHPSKVLGTRCGSTTTPREEDLSCPEWEVYTPSPPQRRFTV